MHLTHLFFFENRINLAIYYKQINKYFIRSIQMFKEYSIFMIFFLTIVFFFLDNDELRNKMYCIK